MGGKKIDIEQAKCQELTLDSLVKFKQQQTGTTSEVTGFDIQAYTGAIVERWFGKLAISIDGISAKQRMPIFLRHDQSKIVGYSTEIKKDGAFSVKGVFSKSSDAAKEVMRLALEGFPWQASIGVKPKTIVDILESASIVVNGQEVTGPAEVWLESEVYETSFVPLGADSSTGITVFSEGKTMQNINKESQHQTISLPAKWKGNQALQDEFMNDFELFKAFHEEAPGVNVKHIGVGGFDRTADNRIKVSVPLCKREV